MELAAYEASRASNRAADARDEGVRNRLGLPVTRQTPRKSQPRSWCAAMV